MLELHEYAASKVKQTAPNMTPKLITLKGMGFDILLAKAKVLDPELRFRRYVQKYAIRGSISSIGRTVLDTLQEQLDLSDDDSKRIINEVLRPYQERLKNLELYRSALISALEGEFNVSETTKSELKDLQEILGLRREDVAPIEHEVLTEKEIEFSEFQDQGCPEPTNEREEDLIEYPRLRHAGIKLRAKAFMLDLFGSIGLALILAYLLSENSYLNPTNLSLFISTVLTSFFYYVIPEFLFEATLGKEIIGISIVKTNGNRISFGTSLSRFIIKFLWFCSFTGIIWVTWNVIFKSTKKILPYDLWTDGFVTLKPPTSRSQSFQREANLDYASPGQRLIAFIIDCLILGFIVGAIYNSLDEIFQGTLLNFCVIVLYFSTFEKFRGATLGKFVTGICVTDISGNRATFKTLLLRAAIKVISLLSFGIGVVATAIAIFKSPRKQAPHDLWTKTVVLTRRRFRR